MSKLAHEIRELRKDIARLEEKHEIVAIGIVKIMDRLKGGIKLTMTKPPRTPAQRKILVPNSSVKILPRERRSP